MAVETYTPIFGAAPASWPLSSSNVFSPDFKEASKFVLAAPASIDALWCPVAQTNGLSKVKGVIYADSAGVPGSRLAISSEYASVVSEGGYYYRYGIILPFAASVVLPAGTYWLGLIGGTAAFNPTTTGVGALGKYNANAYASGPSDPFGSVAGGQQELCIYALTKRADPASARVFGSSLSTPDSILLWGGTHYAGSLFALSVAAVIDAVYVYMARPARGRAAIYSSSGGVPAALLGQSPDLVCGGALDGARSGYFKLPLAAPLELGPASYFICFRSMADAGVGVKAGANVSPYNSAFGAAYAAFPSTFGTVNGNDPEYLIYASGVEQSATRRPVVVICT